MINTSRDYLARVRPHPSKASVIRLVLSVSIATLLWGWISTVDDPEDTIVFANVPIEVPALSGNRDVVTEPQQATVTVTAPRSVVNDIRRSEVIATLDLSRISEAGTYNVPVEASVNHDVRGISVEPREVPIIVQETISEIKPLEFLTPDLEGGTRELGQLQPDVTEVTLTGSSSVMETIDRVIVPIDIGERTSSFTGEFTAIAESSDGVQVNGVTIQPGEISVRVPISTRGKSVPVLVNVVGEPAAGFEEVYRAANPPIVLIDGPADVLAQIPFVTTAPIDIEGQTASAQLTVPITGLPDGVSVLVPGSAEVTTVVQVSARGRRIVLEDQPVTIVGVPPEFTASITPASVDVELLTEAGIENRATPESVTVIIDVSGLPRGVHQARPSVVLPPNTEWLSVDPDQVSVRITDAVATPPPADSQDQVQGTPSPSEGR